MVLKNVMETLPFRGAFAFEREVGTIKKLCQNDNFVLILMSKTFNLSKINLLES